MTQVYTQTVHVTNTLKGTVEASVKSGASERYSVTPSTFRLKPNESLALEIKLRVLKFANRQKAIDQGHRDVFHVKVSICCKPVLAWVNGSSMTHASGHVLFPLNN